MYIDLIIMLNFFFDFFLLLTVSVILKRNVKIKKIILGSLFGSLILFVLFININSLLLFIIKFILSIIMIFITFGIKDIKYNFNNILYFYTTSIILGGFLYFLKINLSYSNIGLYFYGDDLKINYYILVIFSPIILYIYMKQIKKLKNYYSNTYKVKLFIKKRVINLNGFLDTANMLVDPYKKRGVIIVNSKVLKDYINNNNYILIPYDTIDSHGLLKAVIIKRIFIKDIGYKENVVVALSNKSFKMDGIDCILNKLVLEAK